jgi:hypothetical protein
MTFRPYSFQLHTILQCTGRTVKQINFNEEVLKVNMKTFTATRHPHTEAQKNTVTNLKYY